MTCCNDSIVLENFPKTLTKTIHLPASKSISNRVLVLKFLSKSTTEFDLSDADDTVLMKEVLDYIATKIGLGSEIFCKNAGTVFRFLASVLSITKGNWVLTGDKT